MTNIILRDESSREEETQSESSAQTWIFHNPEFRVLHLLGLKKIFRKNRIVDRTYFFVLNAEMMNQINPLI